MGRRAVKQLKLPDDKHGSVLCVLSSFQVQGNGQLYRRSWWPLARRPPRCPAVVGLAWSADNYQLLTLDASSQVRLWWVRPEKGKCLIVIMSAL